MVRIYHESPNAKFLMMLLRSMLEMCCAPCECLCALISYEMAGQELVSTWALLVVDEEGVRQERSRIIASVVWNSRTGITTATDLENGL
jgi:hypothetical protein